MPHRNSVALESLNVACFIARTACEHNKLAPSMREGHSNSPLKPTSKSGSIRKINGGN